MWNTGYTLAYRKKQKIYLHGDAKLAYSTPWRRKTTVSINGSWNWGLWSHFEHPLVDFWTKTLNDVTLDALARSDWTKITCKSDGASVGLGTRPNAPAFSNRRRNFISGPRFFVFCVTKIKEKFWLRNPFQRMSKRHRCRVAVLYVLHVAALLKLLQV